MICPMLYATAVGQITVISNAVFVYHLTPSGFRLRLSEQVGFEMLFKGVYNYNKN